jgi:hypothetical protein
MLAAGRYPGWRTAYDPALGRKPRIERQKSDPTRLNPATTADLPAISHASAANGRLKFNQSFEIVLRDSNMQRVQRFLSKFAMDVLRTMVASAIGALIFTHLGWLGASPVPTQAPVVTVAPTVPTVPTEQVARLVRDEHDVMVQYLKAAHAKEVAAIEKEVREAKAARIAQETAKAVPEMAKAPPETARAAPETAAAIGPAEPGRSVAAPRSIAAARAPSLDGANANSSATIVGGAPPVGGVGPATGANSPGGAIVAGSLPPPIVIPALPEPAPPSQVETPRDMSLADKAVAVTHITDVVSFVRDVSSWFKHEEAPVPPADVRLSPFASAEM